MIDKIKRAIDIALMLGDLAARIMDAAKAGDWERVDKLMPGTLLSEVEMKRANDDARERYKARARDEAASD